MFYSLEVTCTTLTSILSFVFTLLMYFYFTLVTITETLITVVNVYVFCKASLAGQWPCVRAGVRPNSGGWEDRANEGEQRAEDGEREKDRGLTLYEGFVFRFHYKSILAERAWGGGTVLYFSTLSTQLILLLMIYKHTFHFLQMLNPVKSVYT